MSIIKENQVLSTDELTSLRSIQKDFQSIQFGLGEIEILKIQLEEKYEFLKQSLKKTQTIEKEFIKSLEEKYGEISLNLDTGEFSKLEPTS
jgi:predicted DNA-binding antitoxin AbrB/MazE fold protein